MDYNYESLLDQRFQKLCQALLLKEYDDVQCFPIGMADGGRDATSNSGGRLETVFQVKFSHKPAAISNPAKWITDALDDELEKIHRLKDRGASRYILITNAFPTSPLDSGSIDKVNRYLADNIPMESFCWWRDDLDRRLDGQFDLKLAYPSVMSGPDMLRLLWEKLGSSDEARRRKMALTAYFAHQAEQDSTIRFKQAELLPSSLFDLFIDVPAVPHSQQDEVDSKLLASYLDVLTSRDADDANPMQLEGRRQLRGLVQATAAHGNKKIRTRMLRHGILEVGTTGAADVLLDAHFTRDCPYVVLEGAPGQGKSTLSQYLAQLQRVRILNRDDEVSKVSGSHASSPLRMPFKIELRDLASWIKGVDPWSGNVADRHDGPRTLEGAIGAHVKRFSGGFEFDVTDLAFVAQSHPVLVILDALDEVADLEDRHRVVEEVVAAVARLEMSAQSLRVLVTSRPTAVANAPSFPEPKFDYLTLAAIPPRLGLEYAQKWSKARNLRRVDASEITEILREKMSAPHMAELAKNTMQLSILLSLIYHRGSSLPDKRTELYDAYVDSFFNREVEKSRIVRDNRMLLISIHQHLAYYMHARAESNRTTGRIGLEELRQVVTEYLVKHQESEEVLDDLLTGMVERVVALVSRIEGTYEFEVQPLREYFAARYLYDTAPYVPATSTGQGTKPDRFDGIAKNAYWMNVTRFFAGCFTKGELLDLAERVCSLCDSPDMAGHVYPRNLALALLQDWVFSQSKPATERVIDKLYDTYGVRSFFLAESGRGRQYLGGATANLALSNETGSSYFIKSRLGSLFERPLTETSRALAHVVGRQPQREKDEVRRQWQEAYRGASADQRTELIRLASWANIWHPDMAPSLFRRERDIEVLLTMVETDFASELIAEELHRSVLEASLNSANQFTMYGGGSGGGSLSAALYVTRPPLWQFASTHGYGLFNHEDRFGESLPSLALQQLKEVAQPLLSTDPDFRADLNPWRNFLRDLDAVFGPTWTSKVLGLLSGAVRAQDERGAGADELFEVERSICDRVKNARRRGNQKDWWTAQLACAATDEQRELWLATAYCWASVEVLSALFLQIESLTAELSADSINRFAELAANRGMISRRALGSVDVPAAWLRNVKLDSPALALFFGRIEDGPAKDRLLDRRMTASKVNLNLIESMLAYAWNRWSHGFLSESKILAVNKKYYAPGASSNSLLILPASAERKALRSVWEKVIREADGAPDMVLAAAEYELRQMMRRPRPVLRVADKERWFA